MRIFRLSLIALFCLSLTACGQSEEKPTAAGTAAAPAGTETKKEEKHEAPDTHGMPGMSELFKGKDEKK